MSFFQRSLKTLQDGFRKIPGVIKKGSDIFNQVRGVYRQNEPRIRKALTAGEKVANEIVKEVNPEVSTKIQRGISKAREGLDRVNDFDRRIQRTGEILGGV